MAKRFAPSGGAEGIERSQPGPAVEIPRVFALGISGPEISFTRIYIELASAQRAGWGADAPIRVNKERTRMDHQIFILTFGKPAQSYLAGLPGR